MLMSHKLDGCRCFWTGEIFQSRNGKTFPAPPHWFKGMPNLRLDGELYMGRGTFDQLVSVIQTKGSDWDGVKFHVFDLAILHTPIEERLTALAGMSMPPHCQLVPHRLCAGLADLDATERLVVEQGGEGLCLREPGSHYRPGNFWKIKRLFPDLNRNHLD